MTAVRWTSALALLAVGAAMLGGCSETLSLSRLPDISSVPERVMSKEEQRGKVDELVAKAEKHQTEAVKEIEAGK